MDRIVGGDVPIDGQGLDADGVRRVLAARAAAVARREAARDAGVAVLVCLIGGERFAVPLAAIAEVTAATVPVRVPAAPDSLAGLIVRRSLVYNLIDPAAALGVASANSAHALLLRGPVPRLALRVDEVLGADTLVDAVVDVVFDDDAGLTATRILADGARIEVIAVARLLAHLGHRERTASL